MFDLLWPDVGVDLFEWLDGDGAGRAVSEYGGDSGSGIGKVAFIGGFLEMGAAVFLDVGGGGFGEEARAGVVLCGGGAVDGVEDAFGDGDVDAACVDAEGGGVDVDDGPEAALEVGVVLVLFHGEGFGDGEAFFDEAFEVKFDGFLGHGECVVECAERKISRRRSRDG